MSWDINYFVTKWKRMIPLSCHIHRKTLTLIVCPTHVEKSKGLCCCVSCHAMIFFFLILHCFSFLHVTWAFPLSLLMCNFQKQGSSAYFWNNHSEVTEQVEYHETRSIQSHRFHYFQISNQFWAKGTQSTLSISFLLLLHSKAS